ncbi:MAG: periplasmic heavy metal sensor [Rhodobacteraceae bacterium]|nr:periplasmic heavy metal sensor [Paracoccaceae bacterium]
MDRTGTTGRRTRLALIASLGLNLLFVGVAVGIWWRVHDAGGARSAMTLFREMPAEARHAIGRELRAARRAMADDRRGVEADILNAIRAEPFDADGLRDLMARRTADMETSRAVATDLWVRHLSEMATADRAAYAERVASRMARPRGHGRPPAPGD